MGFHRLSADFVYRRHAERAGEPVRGCQAGRRRQLPAVLEHHPAHDLPHHFYLLITRTMAVFKIFGSVNVFTMGTAINSNRSVVLEIYTTAFSKYEFGPASAMSMVLFAIIMVVTGINFVGQKKWVHY